MAEQKVFYGRLSALCHCRVMVACCLVLFLATTASYALAGEQAKSVKDIQLVWSADYGRGEQIFFSTYKDRNWSVPVQISTGRNFVFMPVSALGSDGKIWALWTENGKNGSLLRFTVFKDSHWIQPQRIETGMKNNRAVTVIVDEKNIPWIAWTGTGGLSYSDVFWSRWNGNRWDAPVRAHAKNNVPDIYPALTLDDSGHVFLSWQTYADGKYQTVSQVWDGRQWQMLSPSAEKKMDQKRIQAQKEMPILPAFIQEPYKATLFMKTEAGAWSLPLSRY